MTYKVSRVVKQMGLLFESDRSQELEGEINWREEMDKLGLLSDLLLRFGLRVMFALAFELCLLDVGIAVMEILVIMLFP